MINQKDKELLASKGISEEQIAQQLNNFKKGFPYLTLSDAASIENGISRFEEEEIDFYIQDWQRYISEQHKVMKFVPASGAASRMFKHLFAFAEADYEVPINAFERAFFAEINHFAFYKDLEAVCLKNQGKTIAELMIKGKYKTIVNSLLKEEGLNYGALPKGLLKFHQYNEGARTSIEEHMVEGALYAANADGTVQLHFTVSKEHRIIFEQKVQEKKETYEKMFDVTYNISFSEQKTSTDTIAVDLQNEPFRLENGSILFRPGGHGALVENLNDIDADIVFIKNIDNIVPDRLKPETVKYKQLIAGVLVDIQEKCFDYLTLLDTGKYTHEELEEMIHFVQQSLCTRHPELKNMEDGDLVIYLRSKLNRPIRVCGMVKNEGEPGGGPFLAYNSDGSISLQILESSQIDMSHSINKSMFEKGTHFNPVDLVCSLKDYKGNAFYLPNYIDQSTGFISLKSREGKDLKALELPGLWNGAMSNWNTLFVEVPLETFNPVKTVNDLLREQHQS
jgi:hypothetical protein